MKAVAASQERTGGPVDDETLTSIVGWVLVVVVAMFITSLNLMGGL